MEELKSVQLKKETFIKIVLPLIVAENEKILDDREKLKVLIDKKFTSDTEKQWLRQKLLEYKVKKSDLKELMFRMDMIPVSIAFGTGCQRKWLGNFKICFRRKCYFWPVDLGRQRLLL